VSKEGVSFLFCAEEQNATRAPLGDKYQFVKVKDSSDREVLGLWQRNGRFYFQTVLPGKKNCQRVPLRDEENQPVKTIEEANEAIRSLRNRIKDSEALQPGRAPAFADYIRDYLCWAEEIRRKKKRTLAQEKSVLTRWAQHLGNIRVDQITKPLISAYLLKRSRALARGRRVSDRTLNMDVLVLSNCLKHAKKEGWLSGKIPTDGWDMPQYKPAKRPFFSTEQIEHVCKVALQSESHRESKGNEKIRPRFRNGQLLADALRFMTYSGARVTSALATKWDDVDWQRKQVRLRNTKYDKNNIVVDFNERLERLLTDMLARRLPNAEYLFPGTRSKENVGSLRKTFLLVRAAANLPNLRIHDTRHTFISSCVMAGIDYLSISFWVGHSDGGVLIGKTYSHLNDAHRKFSAAKLSSIPELGLAQPILQPCAAQPSVPDLTKMSVADLLNLAQHIRQLQETQKSQGADKALCGAPCPSMPANVSLQAVTGAPFPNHC
jgi:integrase